MFQVFWLFKRSFAINTKILLQKHFQFSFNLINTSTSYTLQYIALRAIFASLNNFLVFAILYFPFTSADVS